MKDESKHKRRSVGHGPNHQNCADADAQSLHAVSFLVHYHSEHTNDVITRIGGPDADVYITTNPEWRRKLEELTREAFTETAREVFKAKVEAFEKS